MKGVELANIQKFLDINAIDESINDNLIKWCAIRMNTTNEVIVTYIQSFMYKPINRLGTNDTNDQKHHKPLYKKLTVLFGYNK